MSHNRPQAHAHICHSYKSEFLRSISRHGFSANNLHLAASSMAISMYSCLVIKIWFYPSLLLDNMTAQSRSDYTCIGNHCSSLVILACVASKPFHGLLLISSILNVRKAERFAAPGWRSSPSLWLGSDAGETYFPLAGTTMKPASSIRA
jgi:hypothetical protein